MEHGNLVLELGPALARRYAGDERRPVGEHLLAMERARRTRDALANDAGLVIDKDAHDKPPFTAATAFSAA